MLKEKEWKKILRETFIYVVFHLANKMKMLLYIYAVYWLRFL